MSRNLSTTTPKARKPYRCDYCELPIDAGDTHVKSTGICDGYVYSLRIHTACADLARGWDADDWWDVDTDEFRRLLADVKPAEILTTEF